MVRNPSSTFLIPLSQILFSKAAINCREGLQMPQDSTGERSDFQVYS